MKLIETWDHAELSTRSIEHCYRVELDEESKLTAESLREIFELVGAPDSAYLDEVYSDEVIVIYETPMPEEQIERLTNINLINTLEYKKKMIDQYTKDVEELEKRLAK